MFCWGSGSGIGYWRSRSGIKDQDRDTPPPTPSLGVRILGFEGVSNALGLSKRRLVANFWHQVPPLMASLRLQVAQLISQVARFP